MTPTPRLVHKSDLPALLAALRAAPSVAVDTEFHTERSWAPELFLLQLGFADSTTWLVDPLDAALFAEVGPAVRAVPTWLVHGGTQDLRVLADAFGSVPEDIVDTQVLAGLVSNEFPAGLARLLDVYLDVHIDKRATLTDWSRRPLNDLQVRYAASDVLWLHALHTRLMERVTALGREEVARAACSQLRAEALVPPDGDALLRELGGLPGDPVEVSILRSLMVWRDGLAQVERRPARSMVGDASLRQLARLQPESLGELLEQRRLPRNFMRAQGPAILAAVADGRRAALESPPKVVGIGTAAADRSFLLRTVMDFVGRQERFAPGLILPAHLRDDLAADPPPTREALRARIGGWRDALAGPWIAATQSGSIHIEINQGKTEISATKNF